MQLYNGKAEVHNLGKSLEKAAISVSSHYGNYDGVIYAKIRLPSTFPNQRIPISQRRDMVYPAFAQVTFLVERLSGGDPSFQRKAGRGGIFEKRVSIFFNPFYTLPKWSVRFRVRRTTSLFLLGSGAAP